MFKGDSRDFGESFGKRRGEWEEKGKKKLKERERSVRFKDELRPGAPGTHDRSQRLTIFSCRGWVFSLFGSNTFPPAVLKYFSLMMMILKIRGYRLLILTLFPSHLVSPHIPTFCSSWEGCKDGCYVTYYSRVLCILVTGALNDFMELGVLEAEGLELLALCIENPGFRTSPGACKAALQTTNRRN